MQKKQTILVVASLLVVILSVTLAYFTAQIIGKGKDISVTSNNLQILFDHSDGNITGTDITPGWSTTKKFAIKNNSNATYKYNIVIQNLVNTFITEGYLQYKITSDKGGFSTDGYVNVPKSETAADTILGSASIEVGVTQTYTIEFIYKNDENIDQSIDMGKTLSGTVFITEKEEEILTLYDKILADNPTRSERTDFSTPFTESTTGTLFTSTESIATDTPVDVYYFAGDTENNWVDFGGYYWRIIRTNHDSSIRLLYVGEFTDSEFDGSAFVSAFNTISDSPKYIGYMYGEDDSTLNGIKANTIDSTIKSFIDDWYQINLINYTKYLSTSAVYCNDRNLGIDEIYNISSIFNFASHYKIGYDTDGMEANPSYNCEDIKDAFSTDNVKAKLTYPIALMTADEVVFAGGVVAHETHPYSWFISNSRGTSVADSWWLLSAVEWDGTDALMSYWNLYDSLSKDYAGNDEYTVRPVISLKSCVKTSGGDGTATNPYTILETSSGC